MSLGNVGPGKKLPTEFNVVIEIPAHADPIKYEVDKESGALFVDRFMPTAMHYPCNYGYIPATLSEDGDPVDVLVVTPFPVIAGAVISCRAVGMLKMTDESGKDCKILAVPTDKVCPIFSEVRTPEDVSKPLMAAIVHFFEHYKDLEPGKWVKVDGWADVNAAHKEITDSVARYSAPASKAESA